MTKLEIEAKFNSGKSIPVAKSISILKGLGYEVSKHDFTAYRDKKTPGARFVYSRKVVNCYEISISMNGQEVKKFNSEISSHTAYSLTLFVLTQLS